MPNAETTSYTVLDLLSWQESGGLQISPKFQRRSVWNTPAKGHFIDSILLEYPIPPIHIRLVDGPGGSSVREVIDGQQRIRSVFDFIAGAYRIPPSVSREWGGKAFETLDEDARARLRLFSFNVYQYKKLSDAEVLDIFSRLNTYSVSLSAQELRNGRWFGPFKSTSYQLATEALEFWRSHRIFTEQQIARMRESELVSELLIAQMDGTQDKKASIELFYEKLDEGWGSDTMVWTAGKTSHGRRQPDQYLTAQECVSRFRHTLGAVDDALGNLLQGSPLRRPALFYTLYCAFYHLLFGLPRTENLPLRRSGLSDPTKSAIRQVASELTDVFDNRGRTQNSLLADFFEGSARQTDNIGPRELRFTSLVRLVEQAV